jgi:CHAD domain-containing protein
MKAGLDLMRAVLGKRSRRTFNRVTRKLRRRLGPLRDADVMLEHLGELGGEKGRQYAAAGAWLSGRLCRERDKLRKQSAKQSPPDDVLGDLMTWRPVRGQMLAAREAIDSLLAESLHLQLDCFAEQADRLINGPGAADAEDDAARAKAEHQDPHELRISGKALRYTLEMAAVQGHELPESLTKTFKRMQDALGLWHDYVVLADHSMQAVLDAQLSHHEPELTNDVLDLLRELVGRASHHLDDFKRMWRDGGEAVAKAIRTCFPLTRPSSSACASGNGRDGASAAPPVSGSQTGRGPCGSGLPADSGAAPPAGAGDA